MTYTTRSKAIQHTPCVLCNELSNRRMNEKKILRFTSTNYIISSFSLSPLWIGIRLMFFFTNHRHQRQLKSIQWVQTCSWTARWLVFLQLLQTAKWPRIRWASNWPKPHGVWHANGLPSCLTSKWYSWSRIEPGAKFDKWVWWELLVVQTLFLRSCSRTMRKKMSTVHWPSRICTQMSWIWFDRSRVEQY